MGGPTQAGPGLHRRQRLQCAGRQDGHDRADARWRCRRAELRFGPGRAANHPRPGRPAGSPAVHGDGTIYAAFFRWVASTGSFPGNTLVITNAEAIVVRDDNWGTGATPFSALTDPSDTLAGRRVATALSFPFNQTGVAANGQERWGGDISIAVDPRNSSTVYLAYSTLVASVYTLNVVSSADRGATWTATTSPLLSVGNAKNPSLAINSLGTVGLVYQQFTGSGATQRWERTTARRRTARLGDTLLCTTFRRRRAPSRPISATTFT
jgi:hypothetical protein